jgi:enamine deaminase RidA (YjgF/YER057c/UK114 family)
VRRWLFGTAVAALVQTVAVNDRRRLITSGSPYESVFGYSRAVRVGNRVMVSGTGPIWPDGSCDLDPEVQARRCFEIIRMALAEAGAMPDDVVRTRMYITSTGVAEAVGRAHQALFADVCPAATMVVVAGLLDPRWCVEIEAEALLGDVDLRS